MKKSIYGQNIAEESTILGIDFGQAKIGLAIADKETEIAFVFDTLKNDKDFLAKLKKIIKDKKVDKIVIGMVSHEKDPKSFQEKKNFLQLLSKEINITVESQDESFTTKMAQANLKEKGLKNISKIDDAESAKIILQSWLDKNKQILNENENWISNFVHEEGFSKRNTHTS